MSANDKTTRINIGLTFQESVAVERAATIASGAAYLVRAYHAYLEDNGRTESGFDELSAAVLLEDALKQSAKNLWALVDADRD
ncbi:hypothetical protein [Hydrogenimonas sp.]